MKSAALVGSPAVGSGRSYHLVPRGWSATILRLSSQYLHSWLLSAPMPCSMRQPMRNSTRQTVPAKIEPQGNSDVPQRPTPQSQQAVEHYIVPIGMVSSPVHQKVWREERRPE